MHELHLPCQIGKCISQGNRITAYDQEEINVRFSLCGTARLRTIQNDRNKVVAARIYYRFDVIGQRGGYSRRPG